MSLAVRFIITFIVCLVMTVLVAAQLGVLEGIAVGCGFVSSFLMGVMVWMKLEELSDDDE